MNDKKKILIKSIVTTISTLAMFILAFFVLSVTEYFAAIIVVATAFVALVVAIVFAAVFADLASATAFALASAATFAAAAAASVSSAAAFAALVVAIAFAFVGVGADKHNRKFTISCFIGEVIFIAGIISAIIFL